MRPRGCRRGNSAPNGSALRSGRRTQTVATKHRIADRRTNSSALRPPARAGRAASLRTNSLSVIYSKLQLDPCDKTNRWRGKPKLLGVVTIEEIRHPREDLLVWR